LYNATAQYFVGQSGTDADDKCTAKSNSNLGEVRGLCPAEPGREGSFYLPAAANYGRTRDLRADKLGTQDVTAYAVALGGGLPEFETEIGGSPIRIIPSCFNHFTGKPCTLVDLEVNWKSQLGGSFYIKWDGSQQGGDYDMDINQYFYYSPYDRDGNGTSESLRIVNRAYRNGSDQTIDVGYIISGTTDDGAHFDVRVNNNPPVDDRSYGDTDGDLVPDTRYDTPDGQADYCGDGLNDWVYYQDAYGNYIYVGDCYEQSFYDPGPSTARYLESPLWYAAKYGGFTDTNNNLVPDTQSEWDKDGNGVPDSYFKTGNYNQLEDRLEDAITSMLRRVTSGTAASVLASGEGSGANLVQAVYYPKRRFVTQEIDWTGSLQTLWYFLDPHFTHSTIREDTDGDQILNVVNDYIINMYYDPDENTTKADLYESDDEGAPVDVDTSDAIVPTPVAVKDFSGLDALFEAGEKLWARGASTRAIYTYNGVSPAATWTGTTVTTHGMAFTNSAAANLMPLMDVPDVDSDLTTLPETIDLIKFTRGEHLPYTDRDGDQMNDYRDRLADFDLNGDGDTYDAGEWNEWKLGDIIDSTPKISSNLPIHSYHSDYGDYTYAQYVASDKYQKRGLVFVGANDGMLHAFRLGDLQIRGDGDWNSPAPQDDEVAKLAGADLGREEWAYIPRNVLPYLKYIAGDDYCHLLSVDLSPYIFDASIAKDGGVSQESYCTAGNYWNCERTQNSWRTILIGGLRFGGACRNRNENCTASGSNCVNVPVETDIDGDLIDEGVGYSSYFALDITDQFTQKLSDPSAVAIPPKLLWEFSHDELGYSMSGPAVVRINGWDDSNNNGVLDAGESKDNAGNERNGRWIVVFGSGPTGPISTSDQQFMGTSDQNLKFFALDAKTGELLTEDLGVPAPIDTGIDYGFAGSMINVTQDNWVPKLNRQNYEDEVLYVGYTYCSDNNLTSTSRWDHGGVGRLVTNGSIDPDDWHWTTLTRMLDGDDIGPVTSAVAKLEHKYQKKIWVFFGSGRFFYKKLDTVDDMYEPRRIFGVTDKCYKKFGGGTFSSDCSDPAGNPANVDTAFSELSWVDVENDGGAGVADSDGWYIDLDDKDSGDIGSERVITDVLATAGGIAFFTTFEPYVGACSLGGKSYLWALKYNSGASAADLLRGKGLVQVSTGAIEEIDLGSAFTDKGGRRTGSMEGVPPLAQGLSLISPPAPLKKVIHVKER
jgi:type IV pilus assembly protein PilY1